MIHAPSRSGRRGPRRSRAPTGRSTPARAAFAFARGDAVIAATPLRRGARGERIAVPGDLRGAWRDALGDRRIRLDAEARLGDLAAAPLPVALLERT